MSVIEDLEALLSIDECDCGRSRCEFYASSSDTSYTGQELLYIRQQLAEVSGMVLAKLDKLLEVNDA